jgi:putative membrane protein
MRDSNGLIKGALAGMAGGLFGSWVMVRFQKAWSGAAEQLETSENRASSESSSDSEDATMKAAAKLGNLVGVSLDAQQKKKAGLAIHYVFGTLMGGMYGVLREKAPRNGMAAAASYGVGLFIIADEIAVPTAGLSRVPKDYPLSTHAYGLASHLVYGVATELVRREVRRRL